MLSLYSRCGLALIGQKTQTASREIKFIFISFNLIINYLYTKIVPNTLVAYLQKILVKKLLFFSKKVAFLH